MKKLLPVLVILTGLNFSYGQAPQRFNYQAVARDAANQPYPNTELGVQISLLRDGAPGDIAYSERHEVTTTPLGVFTLPIGGGTPLSGDFSTIRWSNHAYYLEVAIDPAGGTDYTPMGSSQLLSVPYALYANQAGGGDSDNDPTNELQRIGVSNDTLYLSKDGGAIPLPTMGLSIPFYDTADLTDKVAFGIANTTSGNGVAIAGRQGSGSSLGTVNSAAIFGTSQQGFGVAGFSSGPADYAGVLGGTNDPTGTGVRGRAEGGGKGGFFESPGGAALVTGAGNVGIGSAAPEVKLEVNGDLRVNADVGRFILGYPDNGNQWAVTTINDGANLLFGSKEEDSATFTPRLLMHQDGRIGVGANQPAAQLEIAHNSTNTLPHFLLTENEADYARLSFQNSIATNVRWNIDGLAAQNPANAKLNFRFQHPNLEVDRMTILGNGQVGISNSEPDEELVVGENIGSDWTVPAVTVGNETGGVIEAGNPDYSISLSANNSLARSRIVADSPDGTGLGKLEVRTDGLSVGRSPGESGAYMMHVVHEGFGVNLQRNNTDFNWEMYVAQGNGELRLYFDGSFRGAFNPATGLYTASDRRFKENIQPLRTVLPDIMQLSPSTFRYIQGNPNQKTSIGFIAQDIENLFPELVSVSSDERSPEVYSLNYAGFGVLAIKAIQEQQKEINDLKARIGELEALLKK